MFLYSLRLWLFVGCCFRIGFGFGSSCFSGLLSLYIRIFLFIPIVGDLRFISDTGQEECSRKAIRHRNLLHRRTCVEQRPERQQIRLQRMCHQTLLLQVVKVSTHTGRHLVW
jgi:hypothetical protein